MCSSDLWKFNGNPITAFPDYTMEVQRQRNNFNAVKAQLRKMNLSYALLFPARLRVVEADTSHFFTTPKDAWDWLHTKGIQDIPEETGPDGDGWSVARRRCKQYHSKKPRAKPSMSQIAQEQAEAVISVSQHDANRYRALARDLNLEPPSGGSPPASVNDEPPPQMEQTLDLDT